MTTETPLPPGLAAVDGRVVYFPVRHHSPTAARAVRDLINQRRFAAVLIEGPSDFSARMEELYLPHVLPIAIYSYARSPEGHRRGAYYPFCIYSPEWQALQAARQTGAAVSFIDLPFSDISRGDDRTNRYADGQLRGSNYVKMLAQTLGVDGMDVVWDTLFELDTALSPENYICRAHEFCARIRMLDGGAAGGSFSDRQREHFMAHQIRLTLQQHTGQVLVVTGGYHSMALLERVEGENPAVMPPAEEPPPDEVAAAIGNTAPAAANTVPAQERGIALTPYSYHRLDGLRGYDAGMPNPGFYDRLWQDRDAARSGKTYRTLLFEIAKMLRERKQRVSSADLIAAETCAQALALMRGHAEVWRTDLVDGLVGSVLKDELAAGDAHPLLEAVHEVLRGKARGTLAAGTALPPLVVDIQQQLGNHGLQPEIAKKEIPLNLLEPDQRAKSILLHRLRVLGIAGFVRTGGTDFLARQEMTHVQETWTAAWSPDFDATAIEAARYGAGVADAAAARLAEVAGQIDRSARDAAALLVDAALADIHSAARELHTRVADLIRQDGEFLSVTQALSHLLYLYRYDESLGSAGQADLGKLLAQAFARGVWLLEILGQMGGEEVHIVEGVQALVETFERCDLLVGMSHQEFVDVLARVQADAMQLPMVRGAAMGALWRLQAADLAQVRSNMKLFANPEKFGDFLTGLFGLAREIIQRNKDLILAVDETICAYSAEDFLVAVPSLRLAFTYFTPREKHHLALNLMQAVGAPVAALPAFATTPEDGAWVLAMETRLFAAAGRYGLRGATHEQ